MIIIMTYLQGNKVIAYNRDNPDQYLSIPAFNQFNGNAYCSKVHTMAAMGLLREVIGIKDFDKHQFTKANDGIYLY